MGQSMLVIAAFSMLSILALSINGTFLTALSTGLEAQSQLNALSMGQALLDEILAQDFDENVTGGARAFRDSDFTATANFGPDGSGETISGTDSTYRSRTRFDDVDDYHNYNRAVKDSILGWFAITSSIAYAKESYPDSTQTWKTFYKAITVSVTQFSLPKRQVRDSTGRWNSVVVPVVLKDLAIYRRYF
jgi:hypothetical protein